MALTVTDAGPDDAAAWDQFADRHAGVSCYHQYAWRGLIEAEFGCATHYLIARQSDGVVAGVLPLARLRSALFGDFLVSLPFFNYGGPLAVGPDADGALMEAAINLARRLRVQHVEFRELKCRDGYPQRTEKVCMVLDLADTSEAQWKALGSKLRSQIKRPQREEGVAVRFGGKDLVAGFYEVFARNMRDLGTPAYARSFFERVLDTFPAGAEVALASVRGKPAAAGITLSHGDVTQIPWASSLREWNSIGVNMLMYWEILQRAIGRGSRQFDFGRSTVDAGTYRFKAQWGAKPRQLYWHYWLASGRSLPRLNPANPKYGMAIKLWQQLPVWTANVIGPYVARRLP